MERIVVPLDGSVSALANEFGSRWAALLTAQGGHPKIQTFV
jgi:hypothetical protein